MFHDHFALSATEKSMYWFFLNIQGPDLNSIPLLLAGFFFGLTRVNPSDPWHGH
jgi:hypothetical protein